MYFFKIEYYWPYIGNSLIDMKKGGASVGYWMNYVTLTIDLTHDLDLGFFKIKFRNNSISGVVGLINVKQKGSKSIRYWADYMTQPMSLTLKFQGQRLK